MKNNENFAKLLAAATAFAEERNTQTVSVQLRSDPDGPRFLDEMEEGSGGGGMGMRGFAGNDK